MPVAIRAITRLQDADDINVSLGAGVDEYALCWDNDTAKFVLRAPFAGILATGATTGATAQAQAFTLGVVSPFDAPVADSTTAWQVRKADKTTAVVTVDTTNARVGIGTTAPSRKLHVIDAVGGGGTGIVKFENNNSDHSGNGMSLCVGGPVFYWNIYASEQGGGSGACILYNRENPNDGVRVGVSANSSISNIKFGHFGSSFTGTVQLVTDNSAKLTVLAAGNVGIGTTSPATRLDIDAGALTMKEMTAPTGVANKAMLYTKDNGSGKTQLCCKLGDDVEVILATQS